MMPLMILLIVKFALVHSFLADARVKNFTKYVFGERTYYGFYRLVYNIYSVVMLLPVWVIMQNSERVLWQIEGVWQPIFMVIQLIGSIGLVISVLQIDFLRFAGLRQVWVYLKGGQFPLPDEPLVTHGLYGFVRHPLYFFSLLAIWFVPVMSDTYFVFCSLATLYFLLGSLLEEGRMIQAYGETYEAYRKQVSWLVPLPFNRH